MENASKALLIAGGILLAMMILSLLVFVFTSMNDFAKSQDRMELTKEIEKFNAGYEAYNKKLMYGTDVITVVNKAIDHNKSVEALSTDPYYINVQIKVYQSFGTTGKKVDNFKTVNEEGYEIDIDAQKIKDELGLSVSPEKFEANTTYNLGEWSGDVLMMDPDILSYFGQPDKDTVKTIGHFTYYIYSALTNFKRAIFTCNSMEDLHGNDGRIDTIKITQVKN